MRVIIPPTGNQTIGMLKTTSLVSVIAYTELLYSAQRRFGRSTAHLTTASAMVRLIGYLRPDRRIAKNEARHG
jgi:polar amino acid transport system permease protein